MPAKSEQLQVRVTRAEKAELKRLAGRAGVDLSSYVLARVLPSDRSRIAAILRALGDDGDHRFALAEFNDLLVGLTPRGFAEAVAGLDLDRLSPFLQNYVAAMIEHAARQKGEPAPSWARGIEPLDDPHFAVPFPSLRAHLLRTAPVAFKRRNIFIDSTIGDRV